MAAVSLKQQKPKMTEKGVRGKILVQSEDGERIGQWGGSECFLSNQTGLGPCLVVRSTRHKKDQGTFFRLTQMHKLISTFVHEGKMTLVVTHLKRRCTVYIETTDDVNELQDMSLLLRDKKNWGRMERNVANKRANGARGRPTKAGMTSSVREPEENEDDGFGYAYDYGEQADDVGEDASDQGTGEIRYDGSDKMITSSTSDVYGEVESDRGKRLDCDASNIFAHPQVQRWNTDQQKALKWVLEGKNVFVTGAAGTGKTEWLLHLIHTVLPSTRPGGVAITGTTGSAARLLGGCTLHAFAGIGRGEGTVEALLERVRQRSDALRAWRQCAVLIIDEIGMLPSHIFTKLDHIARQVRPGRAEEPFGGIQLIVVGDFLQLPPVAKAGEEVLAAFASPSWSSTNFFSVEFRQTFRFLEDIPHYGRISDSTNTTKERDRFARCLADIRRGVYSRVVDEVLTAALHRPLDEQGDITPTAVLARRKDVETYNQMMLDQLESPNFHRYVSEDYAAYPGEDIDSEVSLPAVLTLKPGAQVVLLTTLQEAPSLCNGSLGVVLNFVAQSHGSALPYVRFSSGEELVVSPQRMEVYGRDGSLRLCRTQVPLQLAWALTVHRVQGMTLDMAKVRLDRTFFEYGQSYVALSRVRRESDLTLSELDPAAIKAANPDAVAFYDRLFPLPEGEKARLLAEEREVLEERSRARKLEKERRKAEKRNKKNEVEDDDNVVKKHKLEAEVEMKGEDTTLEADETHPRVPLAIKDENSLPRPEYPKKFSAAAHLEDTTNTVAPHTSTSNHVGPYISDSIPNLTQFAEEEGESFAMSLQGSTHINIDNSASHIRNNNNNTNTNNNSISNQHIALLLDDD